MGAVALSSIASEKTWIHRVGEEARVTRSYRYQFMEKASIIVKGVQGAPKQVRARVGLLFFCRKVLCMPEWSNTDSHSREKP